MIVTPSHHHRRVKPGLQCHLSLHHWVKKKNNNTIRYCKVCSEVKKRSWFHLGLKTWKLIAEDHCWFYGCTLNIVYLEVELTVSYHDVSCHDASWHETADIVQKMIITCTNEYLVKLMNNK